MPDMKESKSLAPRGDRPPSKIRIFYAPMITCVFEKEKTLHRTIGQKRKEERRERREGGLPKQ